MILRFCLAVAAVTGVSTLAALAQATIEGRVELPKTRSAPVMTKRYEVVTKGGVLATNPPLAVVYLEGQFPHSGAPAMRQVVQQSELHARSSARADRHDG